MIRIRQPLDGDDANTSLIIATIARSKPDTPAGAERYMVGFVELHGGFGTLCVWAGKHFYECVTLVVVDDAGLDDPVLGEEGVEFVFGDRDAADEEGSGED